MAETRTMRARDIVEEADRERRLVDLHRRNRVEILRLPFCRVCGGATGLDRDHEYAELACVCEQRVSALTSRVLAMRHARADMSADRSTRIAP